MEEVMVIVCVFFANCREKIARDDVRRSSFLVVLTNSFFLPCHNVDLLSLSFCWWQDRVYSGCDVQWWWSFSACRKKRLPGVMWGGAPPWLSRFHTPRHLTSPWWQWRKIIVVVCNIVTAQERNSFFIWKGSVRISGLFVLSIAIIWGVIAKIANKMADCSSPFNAL